MPASFGDEAQNAANQSDDPAKQALNPENMGQSMMQQVSSMASSAPQAATSAIQGPAQMLTQAPQMLAQAPQQLSSMLSQFAGGFGSALASQTGTGGAGPVGAAVSDTRTELNKSRLTRCCLCLFESIIEGCDVVTVTANTDYVPSISFVAFGYIFCK